MRQRVHGRWHLCSDRSGAPQARQEAQGERPGPERAEQACQLTPQAAQGHPHTSYDIRKDPNWIEAHKYAAPEEIFNGEIGKINNVRFVVSSEAKVWKGAGCPAGLAVYSTLVLGAHAYATTELEGGGMQHIVKQLGYGDDPLNQRASVGWKATKTAERLSEQYMVRIESCSARYSAKALAN